MIGVLIDARCLQGASARRGIGTYARGLLAGFESIGFDFEVLIDADLPSPELPVPARRIHRIRRRWHGRLAGYEDAVALEGDLRRLRPRLYHSLSLTLPGHAPCPVAVTVHDLIPWAFGGWRMAGERLRFRTARRLLPRAEMVIAVSEATARDCQRLAEVDQARIRGVHEGLDPVFSPRPGASDRVARRWRQERPYLIYVGALDVRKDPRGLLTAWDAARADGADVDLLIAGEPGAQAPRAMQGARPLGYVPNEELADLLAAAVCLIFPSRYEGFGLPALEAMGAGCPVVAYRNSSMPEVVGDAGILVANGDAPALGRAAAELARDPRGRSTLVEAGLKRARRFTWREAAQKTAAGYRDLLHG